MDVTRMFRTVDRQQQRRPWLAFPFAVVKKFGDDQAGNLAALMAYYAFVSIFPLLLAFVTVLGLVLPGNPGLRTRLLNSALVDFPVVGDQLRFPGRHGAWWVLVLSLAISLWGAKGAAGAAQYAFNTVWNVPYAVRPGFLPATGRSFGLLLALGADLIATGLLSGVGGSGAFGPTLRLLAYLGSALINVVMFSIAFRLATARTVSTRELLPGAILAALLWQVLLAFGGLLIAHQVHHAQSLYGIFGVILGLLGWLHLQAQLTLYVAEADVVRARHLYPRTAIQPPLTDSDRRAYTQYALSQQRRPAPEQRVGVEFAGTDQPPESPERPPPG